MGGAAKMRRWRRGILVAVMLVLGAPALSAAQAPPRQPGGAAESPAEPSVPSAPPPATVPSVRGPSFPSFVGVLAGPGVRPRAAFEVHPSIGLTEEYTDNFNLAPRDKQENFRTTLDLGLTLLISGARTTGTISGVWSGTYDSSTDEVNADFSSSLSGEVSYQVSPRLGLTASDVLTVSDDPLLGDRLSLRRERGPFVSNVFSLTSDWTIGTVQTREYYQLGTFFQDEGADTVSHTAGASASLALLQTNTLTLGYEYLNSDTSNGDTLEAGSDVTGHRVSGSVSRQLNVFTVVGLSGNHAWRSVTRGLDYRIWDAAVFAGYSVPGIWSVSTSVGYSGVEQEGGSDSSSPTTSTTLTYHFARATATLTADVGFSETFAGGENFGVVRTRGVEASLSYPLTPLVTGTVRGFYRENDFTGVAGGEADLEEDVRGGSVSFSVPLRRWLTLVLEYQYTDAGSSTPDREFTENRATVSLTAVF